MTLLSKAGLEETKEGPHSGHAKYPDVLKPMHDKARLHYIIKRSKPCMIK